ncbi:GNAT family N-acetyltransferase [Actinoplanes sp. NPDC051513]|uniref:GNAT family N-acetyltransferase n=1 Tax=Actinoplanes sp. NPDC051513 TaxID=3363908 RepID=UPI0037AC5C75
MSLATDRLLLRQWRVADREPFAAMNADPVVMSHFPARLTREESDAFADRSEAGIAERGWGLWAVDVDGEFAGFIGLQPLRPTLPFAPGVEIGWRLAARFHGHGYATEGARRVVTYAFDTIGLPQIVSFTTERNIASRRVMEKLGMTRDPSEDFDHPAVPAEWDGRRHVLYRLAALPSNPPTHQGAGRGGSRPKPVGASTSEGAEGRLRTPLTDLWPSSRPSVPA